MPAGATLSRLRRLASAMALAGLPGLVSVLVSVLMPVQAATGPAGAAAPATDPAPPTLPQVRVVQATHTAPIDQIRADARFERLVSASADKTLRIWRLDDLQPLRTVLLPAGPGREGTPYSIAMSADGQRVYAAGYTGWDWHRAAHIYVIDATLGRVIGTVGRFQGEVVTALDLSPDGRSLAVGLGRGGLVVIDVATGRPLRSDPQYAGPVSFVHHAADGRLATAADDGCLRVYARDGKLVHRLQFPPRPAEQPQCTGGRLGGVRFSPDGRWIALGHRDQPAVGIFDASALQLRRTLRQDDAQQQSLCCVAWSPDSRTLFFNGSIVGDQPTPLYRLADLMRGQPTRWDIGRQQFSNMLPMPDGSVVFATTVPSIERVDAGGRVALRADGSPYAVAPANVDFHRSRGKPAAFLLAADGSAIAFEAAPGRWLRADPLHADAGRVLGSARADEPGLTAARRSGVAQVEASTDAFSVAKPLRVGGRVLAMERDENARSWAVHGRLPIAAVGTQWRLWLVDAQARPMPGWETPPFLAAPAHHTVISEDGRWVVVALGDGSVHWFEVASGRERLGLFVHANGIDWVAWRPDGYYASSPQGDRFIGWLVNRGETQAPDLWRAVQFERELYRPDLVQAALREATLPADVAQQLARSLAALAPPRVRIESIMPTGEADTLSIRFSAEATGRPMTEVGVYIDGLPALRVADRLVNNAAEAQRLTRTVTARLTGGPGNVRVEAETARSLGLDESLALRAAAVPPRRPPGTLWVVAVGVGRFDKLSIRALRPLPSASNDAGNLARVLSAQRGAVFAEARISVLNEASASQPTKANVLSQLQALTAMQPDDTLVVFLASHGVALAGDYYFMTQNAEPADLQRLQAARAAGSRLAEGALPSLLSGSELTAALRRLPGRRVLMLDTCHAGALGSSDPYALIKRSASAQLALLSAARGDESSFDAPDRSGGIFTGALVRALGPASRLPPGPVTLRAAFDAAGPETQAMLRALQDGLASAQDKARIVQTPVMSASPALQSTVLASRPN